MKPCKEVLVQLVIHLFVIHLSEHNLIYPQNNPNFRIVFPTYNFLMLNCLRANDCENQPISRNFHTVNLRLSSF